MTPVPEDTIVIWWAIALGLTVVVLLVVAVMLELVVRSTKRIHSTVRDIWFGGTRIAANTVTIALLRETNVLAGELLTSAGGIAQSAVTIRAATQKR